METRLTETGSAGGRDKARLVLILAWAGAVIAVLPAILHWAPHATANGSARALRMAIANLLAFAICYAMYRAEKRRIGRALALALVFLVVLLAAIVNQMHKTIVDYGVPHSTVKDNTQYKNEMIVDFFAHSGSTLLAAEILDRRCCTGDVDPVFCEIAIRRLEQNRRTGRVGWQNGHPFEKEIPGDLRASDDQGRVPTRIAASQPTLFE